MTNDIAHWPVPPPDWMHPDEFRRLVELRRQREAWGPWLNRFRWHHFVTLTFGGHTYANAAVIHFLKWVRRLERRAQHAVHWFFVVELDAGGGAHVHCLVGNTHNLTTRQLSAAWHLGFTRVLRFNPRQGAAYYVSKHIGDAVVQYDISPRLKRVYEDRTDLRGQ